MAIRLLYVEDEPSLARIVSESLDSRGFHVDVAQDGNIAIEKFASGMYDLCVLDIMLPKMDGYSVAEKFMELRPDIPIIFLSAKTQTKDVVKGFQIGARDYMRKPFSMEELIIRINNLLKYKSLDRTEVEEYILGALRFLPKRHELINEGRTTQLSERESSLLQLLCLHQNETCDRRHILKSIWGDDSFYNSRNLDVYINKLRKLLAEDSTLEIVTLKGAGYIFKVN